MYSPPSSNVLVVGVGEVVAEVTVGVAEDVVDEVVGIISTSMAVGICRLSGITSPEVSVKNDTTKRPRN